MDRISALRNVEEALTDFEDGDCDLETMERRVRATLRSYATEFDDLAAYRATGPEAAAGTVVVAPDPREARDRVARAAGADPERVTVEPLSGD
jgi:hypothetical protein